MDIKKYFYVLKHKTEPKYYLITCEKASNLYSTVNSVKNATKFKSAKEAYEWIKDTKLEYRIVLVLYYEAFSEVKEVYNLLMDDEPIITEEEYYE